MNARFDRALALVKGLALPFGVIWVLGMGFVIVATLWKNPTQPYYWGNILAAVALGYVLILFAVFLITFLCDRR